MRFLWRSGARVQGGGVVDYVIAGLGNPGREYEHTRHNAGFMAADSLSAAFGIPIKKLKFHGLYGMGVIAGKRVVLLKPQTFMNLSGRSVRECLAFFKLPPERAVVIFDDVSLPPGKLRIRERGSDGGHNGIKDIIYQLKSDAFPRIKIGVGLPPAGVGSPPDARFDMKDWVTSGFSASERKGIGDAIARVSGAVEVLLKSGAGEAMNRYNGG